MKCVEVHVVTGHATRKLYEVKSGGECQLPTNRPDDVEVLKMLSVGEAHPAKGRM